MAKMRGREHTTLTETATLVVSVLKRLSGVKMIAPGIIKTTGASKRGQRFVTAVYTTAGMELIITGQSVQKVSVHADHPKALFEALKLDKRLSNFSFKEREKKPGV